MINIPEKEDIELRIKCLELAKELFRDSDIFRTLVVSKEIYRLIVKENDAEIDAVIEHYQEKGWRFNQYSLRE